MSNIYRVDMASANAPGDMHHDKLLSSLLIGYPTPGYISNQLFPKIPVQNQTGKFATIERDNWWRRPGRTERSPGTEPLQVGYTVGSADFSCRNYALGTWQAYETLDNADPPHAPLQRSSELVKQQLDLDSEIRHRDLIVSNVGTTISPAAAWNAYGASDPLGDVKKAQKAIRRTTGQRANVAAMDYDLWLEVQRHPDIVKAASPLGTAGAGGMIAQAQFASLIGVDKLLISEGIQITSPEGQPNVFSNIFSTYLILAHVAPNPGIMVPTFGYTFNWTGPNIGAGMPGNYNVLTARNDKASRVDLWTGYYSDEKIVDSALGALVLTGF